MVEFLALLCLAATSAASAASFSSNPALSFTPPSSTKLSQISKKSGGTGDATQSAFFASFNGAVRLYAGNSKGHSGFPGQQTSIDSGGADQNTNFCIGATTPTTVSFNNCNISKVNAATRLVYVSAETDNTSAYSEYVHCTNQTSASSAPVRNSTNYPNVALAGNSLSITLNITNDLVYCFSTFGSSSTDWAVQSGDTSSVQKGASLCLSHASGC